MAEILSTLSATGTEGTPANGGARYTSMVDWENAQQGNLTNGDNVAGEPSTSVLECYAFTCTETGSVYVDGWTTSATNSLTITSAAGVDTGAIDAGFVLTSATSASTFYWSNSIDSIHLYGLQIDNSSVNALARALLTGDKGGSIADWSIKNCIFRKTSTIAAGYVVELQRAGMEFWNNLVLSYTTLTNISYSQKLIIFDARYSGLSLYNNTFSYDTTTATYRYALTINYAHLNGNTVSPTIKNNAIYAGDGVCVNYSGATASTFTATTFNATSDAVSFGSDQVTNITTADFADYAGEDYSPASGGKLDGTGFDLSTSFTTDIAGATRTVPWTIGAYIVAGGPPPVGIQEMYIKDGGIFVKYTPHVKVGGTFQEVDAYVLEGGAWVPVHEK